MQFILDFIDFIVNTITTVWDFFMNIIKNITLMIEYLGIALEICYKAIASMPTWIQAFGTLTITISLLYMLVGRDTGGSKQ